MTSRSRTRPAIQGDIFDPAIAEARKVEAIEVHEDNHHRLLEALRLHLQRLFYTRQAKHGAEAFVTADDAVHMLKVNIRYLAMPGPWMGALFKAPGWKFTGKWVASVRASNNGRMNRCWRYEA